jgi:hypothetical protein
VLQQQVFYIAVYLHGSCISPRLFWCPELCKLTQNGFTSKCMLVGGGSEITCFINPFRVKC